MPQRKIDDLIKKINATKTIVAIAGMLLACTALLGNALQLDWLRNFTPWGTYVKTNPALCLALISVSLLLLSKDNLFARRTATLLSLIVALISSLTLCEWIFGWNIGIDQLIFPEGKTGRDSLLPGRMPTNAAAAFLLLSISLISGLYSKDKRLSQILAYCACGVSLLSVAGSTFRVAALAQFGSSTLIAFPLAVALLFISSALFIAYPGEGFTRVLVSRRLGGSIARHLLPATILFPFLGLLVMLTGISTAGLLLVVVLNCLVLPAAILLIAVTIDDLDKQRLDSQEEALELQIENARINQQQESEERFKALLESAPDAILISDESGKILIANQQAEITFGYSKEELIEQKVELLVPPHLRLQHESMRASYFENPYKRLLGAKKELRAVRKDGTDFPIELSLNPVKLGDGSIVVASAVRDVTERKIFERKLEEAAKALQERTVELEHLNVELKKARDQAVEASHLKSEFLASMSHEIRTPMNGVLGMTELLVRTGLNDQQYRYALTIKESGTALLKVINDILDFTKIEAGKLSLHLEDFDPIRLVEGVSELLAAQALQKGLLISTYIDPQIPASLHGDCGRLRQVLMNLVGNAIKFSTQGTILIRATAESQDNNYVKIKISVSDNGIGLTEEQMTRLFQPYVQLDTSMTRRYDSTGLGLNICKRLINLMGGEIGVSSAQKQGSTFWFSVSLAKGKDGQIRLLNSELRNARVLVVDDDETARGIIHDYIESWGMSSDTAQNAQEALELLHKNADSNPYAIAIIDMVMPDTHGLDLSRIIRSDDKLKQTKLILATAFDNPAIGEEIRKEGLQGYLIKPIRQSQLFDCISSVLQEPQSSWMQNRRDIEYQHFQPEQAREERLLVAEDHPINQEVALLLLKDLGFEAKIAQNGLEALEKVQQGTYDLILMDCQMPQLNGFDATRAIRKLEEQTGKHVPIVAMTAHAIEGGKEQCIAAGMDDFISKPIDPAKLKTVLDRWLPFQKGISSQTPETAIKESGSLSPIDMNRLVKNYGKETARHFCHMFLESAEKELTEINSFLQTRNRESLIESVHGLKGDCATIYAIGMKQICEQLEAAAQQQPSWEQLATLRNQLEQSLSLVTQQVNEATND